MYKLVKISMFTAWLWILGVNAADACYCGVARLCCRRTCCCCRVPCTMQCYTVMKTCQKVIYEEEERTFYKTVYKEVVDKKVVPTTKFVEETQYRCVPFTGYVPKPVEVCPPAKACEPACGPCAEPEMVPVQCLRKAPYTAFREVPAEKIEERPRIVVEQVPYTVTCCIPKTICVQVPVTICCPMPCCGQPTCSPKNHCGG